MSEIKALNGMWDGLKSLLFRIPAEDAHHLAVKWMQFRYSHFPSFSEFESSKMIEHFGVRFRNRVGLAAGFDKNAELVSLLYKMGFGFAEIGTVTPRAQPGNERPRLFRDPSREALFNRMGFNNLGAELISQALEEQRKKIPANFPVGVNIGKNKDTSLEDAHLDYKKAAIPFLDLADYFVINVSSPNTPGLRSLQTLEALKPILESVLGVCASHSKKIPVLLKLAPELSNEEFASILEFSEKTGISGFILTNTLAGNFAGSSGGFSGGPLVDRSREVLSVARAITKLPIISVGGIMTEAEALARRKLGAELVQIYTGWIYRGPGFPFQLAKTLDQA